MYKKQLLLVFLTINLIACQFFGAPQTPPRPTIPATITPEALLITIDTPALQPLPDTPTSLLPPVNSSTFPEPADFSWEAVVVGLQRPVDLQHTGDGTGRLFAVEKAGRIYIIANGQLVDLPFLDISDRVGSSSNEQGLLGLAFHPGYQENGRFFVNYTDQNGNTIIARYLVSGNPNLADPSSEMVLLRVNQPFPNHNGGVLAFGPDGYLYAGLGDGGAAGDPFGNGQKLDTLLGKILRLDVDSAEPYAVPADNPFGNEIWLYGLRNPWRISFDRLTGDLFIGDVGQNQWEEIDFVSAGTAGGQNFGWNYYEGGHVYQGKPPQDTQFIPPIAEYDHSLGCSVTGGYVYRGAMPEWQGIYLFADYCKGTIWGLLRSNESWQSRVLFDTGLTITSFGQDQAGEIYLVSDSGQVLKLDPR
jgi:glucose/arabinose dehydrogenase